MEREIIIFDGKNEKEVGDFYGKHAGRIFDENKKKYEEEKKERANREARKTELEKHIDEYIALRKGQFSESTYSFAPSDGNEGTSSGSSGHYGWSGTSGTPACSPYENNFCYTYYIDQKIIPAKMNWKVWERDWKPPQETVLKYLNISSLFGCFILYEGDALMVDENGIHKLQNYCANMIGKSTMSSGPK